jgi:hypothetical protein
MNMLSAAKRFLSKRSFVPSFVAMLFLLGACVAGTHMIAKDTKPALATKPDKAVLVIIRTTSFGWGSVVTNYLDGKLIGQTEGKSYFMTAVAPGTHYLIADAGNKDTARMRFEAGRIYFLNQAVHPGYHNVTTHYAPMTLEEAKREITEATYYVYDTQKPGKDLSEKDLKEAKADFEKANKEDPAHHKDVSGYKGYKLGK